MAIYIIRNTEIGNGIRETKGTREMFTRIPANLIILTFQGMFKKTPRNVPEIQGNVSKDSWECSKRF